MVKEILSNTNTSFHISKAMCNIPNFRTTIYGHEPIDHDDYIDVLFLYCVKDPTAYEHDDFLCILSISQLLMIIYVYICVGCVGNGP